MAMNYFYQILFSIFLFCSVAPPTWGFTIIDPFPEQPNTAVARFNGQIHEGINEGFVSWPSGIPPEGVVYQNSISDASHTYGIKLTHTTFTFPDGSVMTIPRGEAINNTNPMPLSSYFARSTIDTAHGFISSEANHPGASYAGVASGGFAYTRDLPTGASFSLSGNLNQSATIGINVYAATPTGAPLSTWWDNHWYGFMPDMQQGDALGSVLLTNVRGNLSWQVERWTWQPSGEMFPTLEASILASGTGMLDFTLLNGFIRAIVNNRTSDYYYGDIASVYSSDLFTSGHAEARLNFDTTPVPEPGTVFLLGAGLFALAGMGRKASRRMHKAE